MFSHKAALAARPARPPWVRRLDPAAVSLDGGGSPPVALRRAVAGRQLRGHRRRARPVRPVGRHAPPGLAEARAPRWSSACSGALLILLGVAAGGATSIRDADLDGTTWMTAQANLVLIGALTAGVGRRRLLGAEALRQAAARAARRPRRPAAPARHARLRGPRRHQRDLGQPRLMSGGDIDAVRRRHRRGAQPGLRHRRRRGGRRVRGRRRSPWPSPGARPRWPTTRGTATRSSGPPRRRPRSATSPALPEVTSEAPVYDARYASTEGAQ